MYLVLPAIVPCEQMDCKIGMHCELGRVICAPGSSCGEEGCSNVTASKCSARPTKCAPGCKCIAAYRIKNHLKTLILGFLDFLTLILIGEYEVEAEGSGGGSTPANPPTGNR